MPSGKSTKVNKSLLSIEEKGPAKIEKENQWYIAHFPSLNIASQGRSEKAAKNMLDDATKNVIEVYIERGTLYDNLIKNKQKIKVKISSC